jgi:hypothetical protein
LPRHEDVVGSVPKRVEGEAVAELGRRVSQPETAKEMFGIISTNMLL